MKFSLAKKCLVCIVVTKSEIWSSQYQDCLVFEAPRDLSLSTDETGHRLKKCVFINVWQGCERRSEEGKEEEAPRKEEEW